MAKYDGSQKGYSIAGLAFDLYHEFFHVNTNAGRHGLSPVGSLEKGNINPQNEFLANYYASCRANLPWDNVVAYNYYYKRSISTLNYLLHYSNNPAAHIVKYMDKIVDMLCNVPKEFQQTATEMIQKQTGIIIKL